MFEDRPPGGLRPGDLVVGGRVALLKNRPRWPDLSAGLSLKLPTGAAARLDGSGRADYGAALQVRRRIGRVTLHAGYAQTRVGEWALAPGLPLGSSRSLFGACAVGITSRSTLVVQILRSSGPFRFRPGSDLGRVAQEIAAGLRSRTRGGFFVEWAIIENLDTALNAPDVGLFVGLGSSRAPSATFPAALPAGH